MFSRIDRESIIVQGIFDSGKSVRKIKEREGAIIRGKVAIENSKELVNVSQLQKEYGNEGDDKRK